MVRTAKSKIGKKEKNDRLYKAILMLETEEECYNFFQDLCTVSELRSMEQRYEVATLLNDGMIYNDILERTGASSATISRVNRSLIYGNGGIFIPRQAASRSSSADLAAAPPAYCPVDPSDRTTRWHGITTGSGLRAQAVPTARTAFGLPTAAATVA